MRFECFNVTPGKEHRILPLERIVPRPHPANGCGSATLRSARKRPTADPSSAGVSRLRRASSARCGRPFRRTPFHRRFIASITPCAISTPTPSGNPLSSLHRPVRLLRHPLRSYGTGSTERGSLKGAAARRMSLERPFPASGKSRVFTRLFFPVSEASLWLSNKLTLIKRPIIQTGSRTLLRRAMTNCSGPLWSGHGRKNR